MTVLEDEVLEDSDEFDWRGGNFRPNVFNFSRSVSVLRKQPDNTTEYFDTWTFYFHFLSKIHYSH